MGKGGHSSCRIVRPKTDKATYDFFALPNGIHVLLISDREADKAAAAMDVSFVSIGRQCPWSRCNDHYLKASSPSWLQFNISRIILQA